MNKEIFEVLTRIINRADDMNLLQFDRQAILMDFKIAIDCLDLDLYKLLKFDDNNFTHDIIGIQKYVNRKEMTFNDMFLPRCSN